MAINKIPPGIPPEEPLKYYPTLSRQKDVGNLIYDLGHYGGLHQPYRTEDLIALELNSVKSAVKLAKEVNLASQTDHLVVRDLIPDLDFRDGNDHAIANRGWRQPWSGFYQSVESDLQVYRINRSVDYHNKVYVFWGLRYINRGPADEDPVCDSSSVTIKDSVNTYDVWTTEGLDVNKEMHVFKPILVKNYVEYSIYVRPKTSGASDNYMILGKVVEQAGNTVMGSPVK